MTNMYGFSRKVVERLQLVHSHEIEQLQLADLPLGAISYLNRDMAPNHMANLGAFTTPTAAIRGSVQ
uniref:Uncharacterized protein n=1 Tax=Candidatus Kentrum sp. FM TaxID=2126340 RepID=A0A450VS35_9GAMM|nr:MAG: Protein of unknown function (DUF3800) [Candidatus Kentron sp. FM]VFJ48721.1 MAG: Protein of unknown function (DUF3800) [Candidatus Kentron sp. FM]VFK07593.1 MAG: Protein of unknown function (DUF3800) [Candidatus Kentron sp. FM]